MNYSKISTPDIRAWQSLAEIFRNRLSGIKPIAPVNLCIDQKFMLVQLLHSDLQSGSRYQSRNVEKLVHDLATDLEGLLSSLDVKLSVSCFGNGQGRIFFENDYLGIWCLLMELATRVERGSTIELTLGSLSHGIELEIGCDSRSVESGELLASEAWEFTRQLISVDRAVDLKCPVGGCAIQLDLSGRTSSQRRVA